MNITSNEIFQALASYNPWWHLQPIEDLPHWHRSPFEEIMRWVETPPVSRAVFISGARQVGKTTLLMQAIKKLLDTGVNPKNILYASFDNATLKLAGEDRVLAVWRERMGATEGLEYLFFDEAQFIKNWGTWVKQQVDFNKSRRIIFTGSAMPLVEKDQESGVGRWHTIRITTLSFYEYTQLKKINLPKFTRLNSLTELFSWDQNQFDDVIFHAKDYLFHFHEYFLRGGFPQTAVLESANQAQKLLREDIVDKVLKRDMTALYGVRHVIEIERLFLYLCRHNGGMLDMNILCENLEINKSTALRHIELFVNTHLIFKLDPYGYGKEVLRGKSKIYLADPAIAPAVMMKGTALLDDPAALGAAAEAAVLKHLIMRYYKGNLSFNYWRGKADVEVDLIANFQNMSIPFEVKYTSQKISQRDFKGLIQFAKEKKTTRGYIVTKQIEDFGEVKFDNLPHTRLIKIPAALLCYWLGEMEIDPEEHDSYKD